MATVLIIFSTGIVLGYFIRKQVKFIRINDVLINIAIYLLLFFLGIAVGSNEEIVRNFQIIGFNAFLISLFAVLGSIIIAWIINKLVFKEKK